jgi:peptide/nickel transport system substrate-binding protein
VLLAIGIGREHVIAVPARGGTLSIGFVGTPQTINPIFARPGTVDYALTKMLFRGLTRVDDQLQVQPDLAEDISPSADGKVYTIRLRDG